MDKLVGPDLNAGYTLDLTADMKPQNIPTQFREAKTVVQGGEKRFILLEFDGSDEESNLIKVMMHTTGLNPAALGELLGNIATGLNETEPEIVELEPKDAN